MSLVIGLDAHMVGARETGNETWARMTGEALAGVATASPERGISLLAYVRGRGWNGQIPGLRFAPLRLGGDYMRLGLELPARTVTDRLSVLHVTGAMPALAACPVVSTVHDVSFRAHPEWFSPGDLRGLNLFVGRAVRRAARVVTVSEFARQEILDAYGVAPERVVAVPNGPGMAAAPMNPAEARRLLDGLGLDPARPYLLAVGNLQPRKNFARLIKAFLRSGEHDAALVIAGRRHWRGGDVEDAAARAGHRVLLTGYVDDHELAALYSLAAGVVAPSLHEGFGLVPLEAMLHGVPVAVARAGALPEVCGDAAIYFDPLDVEQMAVAIGDLLHDDERRRELVEDGTLRAGRFTWARAAEQLVKVYEEVAGA